ncbi:MAG: beta-1,3-glucanase family protein [Terrimicrobiaceae bacterium]|nr:beta-1,3-glucanase family protein [Terrimicrobiaceae bacterium]
MLVSTFQGRVYISYGAAGLQSMGSPGNGYTPDAGASGDLNYSTRYQYIEPTFAVSGPTNSNTQVHVDLTYIDFTSISLSLSGVNAPSAQNNPQTSQNTQAMVNAAVAASLTTNAAVLPSAADILPSASFARVISPGLGTSAMYHDFSAYLAALDGKTVTIKGVFAGVGTQPTGVKSTQQQTYDYTATFSTAAQMVTLVANADSGNGADVSIPLSKQGTGVGNNATITVTYANLNTPTGIYGNNAPYTISNPNDTADYPNPTTTTGITNDVYGRIAGDLFGGLDMGYVGSTTLFAGTPIGQLPSTEWWGGGNGATGTYLMPGSATPLSSGATPGIQGIYFNKVQSNSQYYDPYANALIPVTTGYGFPFGDRLGGNLLYIDNSLDANSYLLVTINPDQAAPAPTPPAPTVRILGRKKIVTEKPKLVVKGKAGGDVTSVTYRIGRKRGKAKGGQSWKFAAHLKIGRNPVIVISHGPGGASAPQRIVIIRKH